MSVMRPSKITIHCSASPNGKPVTVEEVTRWHKARGFTSIGYHFIINPDGKPAKGRPLDQVGAHVKGANQDNIGICLIGTDKFTFAQFETLRELVLDLCMDFGIPVALVFAHYEFASAKAQGKTCPNIKVEHLRDWLFNADPAAIAPYLFTT